MSRCGTWATRVARDWELFVVVVFQFFFFLNDSRVSISCSLNGCACSEFVPPRNFHDSHVPLACRIRNRLGVLQPGDFEIGLRGDRYFVDHLSTRKSKDRTASKKCLEVNFLWDLRFHDRQDPRRLNVVGATFKTFCAVSQTVGVGEMFLKCFSWLDTYGDEKKCSERWREASVEADKDALKSHTFL